MTEKDLLQLRALALIQTADITSVLEVVHQLATTLRPSFPGLLDPHIAFLKLRKLYLHAELEHLETSNPALAAILQHEIDQASKLFPFDYE